MTDLTEARIDMTEPANGLAASLTTLLAEDERLIDEYERSYYSAAAGSYEPVTPPGWGRGEPFDPSRQRAEIETKRRIIDLCVAEIGNGTDGAVTAESVLSLLALPHADREVRRP